VERARFGKEQFMSMMDFARTAGARNAGAAASRPNWPSAMTKAVTCGLVFAALVCAARPASAQFTQQGQKLVGTGAVGAAEQGTAVALSADGKTAIWGAPNDNSDAGAAWVFSQSGGVWSQQGAKQVGAGAVGNASQGSSVALSADGNTAIVGGPDDNAGAGAAWVFTLDGSAKLIGTGAIGFANQGLSVALTPDGNTAIVGGPNDDSEAGAAWVFTRSGGVWTAGGTKLPLGTGAIGDAQQGNSVALSADGNTAIMGGPNDNAKAGAVWIFTRSGSTWTQQGSKLLGGGAVGNTEQGYSVALSADGNTAIVGGPGDNADAGAVWVFTRSSGGVWTQQGPKLVGGGAAGAAYQGYSIALSADGNTAIVSGPGDNSDAGATWVFTRSGGGVWTQQGPKLVGSGAVGSPVYQGWSVALSADGTTAILGGPNDNADTGAAWVFIATAHVAGSFTATPTSGAAPLAVTFRAMGLPLPMTYTVNFGDGTSGALSEASCFGSRSGVQCSGSASHTYGGAGTYSATLMNALGTTFGAATITAGGNLVKPLRPPLPPRGARPPPSPPVVISTPTPERHSLDQ
jgi:hypothetical protein